MNVGISFVRIGFAPVCAFILLEGNITAQIKSLAFAYATSIFHPNEDNKELLTWTNTFNHHRGTDYEPHRMQGCGTMNRMNSIELQACHNQKPKRTGVYDEFGTKIIIM